MVAAAATAISSPSAASSSSVFQYDDSNDRRRRWSSPLREWRHSSLWMTPLSFLVLLLLGLLSAITLIFQIPSFLLSFFMTPLLQRSCWLVEFLYPTWIAGWCHISLIQWWMQRTFAATVSSTSRHGDKNRGFHSRTIEQRMEVVMGRVYIHPIAQLLDNVAYLVVCCPPDPRMANEISHEIHHHDHTTTNNNPTATATATTSSSLSSSHNNNKDGNLPIVAFVVDCADTQALLTQIEMIRDLHYPDHTIHLQSIMSTHKHHDHTAGNKDLVKRNQSQGSASEESGGGGSSHPNAVNATVINITTVFGGAVERIPYCNHPVVNGEKLELPRYGRNDMNELVEVEVIAVPAHTRGSVTYALRPKRDHGSGAAAATAATTAATAFLFTGDTIFSGGGGVPFEADVDTAPEHKKSTERTGRSFIKAGAGTNAVERCFAEVLARGLPFSPIHHRMGGGNVIESLSYYSDATDRMLICPGHEYTAELLQRQFLQTIGDSCKWKIFAPSAFFETVSQFYVALHRRSLPHNSGKLLAIPSPLSREMKINPHYRLLTHRGEYVARAIRLWYRHFQRHPTTTGAAAGMSNNDGETGLSWLSNSRRGQGMKKRAVIDKTPSRPDRWNLSVDDVRQPVFTTVYTTDLDQIIQELNAGSMDAARAVQRLEKMKTELNLPVVGRRPIPGSLPADKVIYKGILGLIVLGSPPCAFSWSDSRAMKIPPPMDRNSDKIRISMRRLVAVLGALGLLMEPETGSASDRQEPPLIPMMEALWQEAMELDQQQRTPLSSPTAAAAAASGQQPQRLKGSESKTYNATDVEDSSSHEASADLVELGVLKWLLYGVSGMTPSWLGKYCLPCKSSSSQDGGLASLPNPIHSSKMRQKHGELVRHDVLTCPLCRSATGCPDMDDVKDYLQIGHHSTSTSNNHNRTTRSSEPLSSSSRSSNAKNNNKSTNQQQQQQAQSKQQSRDRNSNSSNNKKKQRDNNKNGIPPVMLRFGSKEIELEEDNDGESVEMEAVPLHGPFI